MGEALAFLALLLFSCNALLVSVASPRLGQELGFLVALGTNVLFAGLLSGSSYVFSDRPFDMDWSALLLFALGGFFATYLGRRLFFLSVEAIGPSRATSLQITNPVFAGVISWVFLGEALGLDAVAYIAVVVAGLYLTTRVGDPGPVVATTAGVPEYEPVGLGGPRHPRGEPAHTGLPTREITMALIGALAYAIGNVVRSTGVREWNEPIFGGFVGALAGTAAYLVLHTHLPSVWSRLRDADRTGLRLWALSGVLTVSAQISTIAATRHIPIAVAVVVSAALPVFVIPVSVILLGNREAVTGRTVAGGVLMLVGVAGLLLG